MSTGIDPRRIEILDADSVKAMRRLGPMGRLRMLERMSADGRTLMLARVRAEHPDWNAEEVAHELARRLRREPA